MQIDTHTLGPEFFSRLQASLNMLEDSTSEVIVETLLMKINLGTVQLVSTNIVLKK